MPKQSTTTIKIPKRIAGYKVPKKLRKAGKKIAAGAANPLVLELMALGFGLASAALSKAARASTQERGPAGAVQPHLPPVVQSAPTGKAPPPVASNDPHEIGVALGKMAEAALSGLFRPKK